MRSDPVLVLAAAGREVSLDVAATERDAQLVASVLQALGSPPGVTVWSAAQMRELARRALSLGDGDQLLVEAPAGLLTDAQRLGFAPRALNVAGLVRSLPWGRVQRLLEGLDDAAKVALRVQAPPPPAPRPGPRTFPPLEAVE